MARGSKNKGQIKEMADQEPFRVILWCVPRSASTVLTKCFSFLDNTQTWFEPYSLAFFQDSEEISATGTPLPRRVEGFDPEAFMKRKRDRAKGTSFEYIFNLPSVDQALILRAGVKQELDNISNNENVFVKDMSFGITNFLDLLPSKEAGFKHAFLIRSPRRVFPAWRRLMIAQESTDSPIADEAEFDMTSVPYMMPGFSYKCQFDLWQHVRANLDPNPAVIDADDILDDPLKMLSLFAREMGMPFSEERLSWDASSDVIATWRCFIPLARAKPGDFLHRTHSSAMYSSGFHKRVARQPDIMTPDVTRCIEETTHYYDKIAEHKMK